MNPVGPFLHFPGIPKPRVTDRPSGLPGPTVVTSNPKPSVNQGSGAARPSAAAAASKLPVKNLPTSLSSSSLGSAASESNGSSAAPSKRKTVCCVCVCVLSYSSYITAPQKAFTQTHSTLSVQAVGFIGVVFRLLVIHILLLPLALSDTHTLSSDLP